MKIRPYEGGNPYLFVSYSHKNMNNVLPIIERMQKDGYRVWYDEGVDPGSEWDENIALHLKNSNFLIAFLSEQYLESSNCKDEINYARDLEKPRLLVYLEKVILLDGMQMRLGRNEAIYKYCYTNEDDFFEKLYIKKLDACKESDIWENGENDVTVPVKKDFTIANVVKTNDKDAKEGIVDIQAKQSQFNKENIGTKQDSREAFKQYRREAELGIDKAQYELGRCYEKGIGTDIDVRQSAQWYHKAADQGYIEAMTAFAVCLEKGRGIQKNRPAAARWMEKAAWQGNATAQYELGRFYEMGIGVDQSFRQAEYWYKKAADQSHDEAAKKLLLIKDGELTPLGAEEYYLAGITETNEYEGLQYLKMAAKTGHAKALTKYGDRCYLNKDFGQAVQCWKAAAEKGDNMGAYKAGLAYYKGKGCKRNYNLAVIYLTSAATAGIPEAQYQLGRCCEYGKGIKQDINQAVMWYKKSAKQGYQEAEQALKKLDNE